MEKSDDRLFPARHKERAHTRTAARVCCLCLEMGVGGSTQRLRPMVNPDGKVGLKVRVYSSRCCVQQPYFFVVVFFFLVPQKAFF